MYSKCIGMSFCYNGDCCDADDVYNNSGWTRLSLLGVLDWKVTEKDRLTLNIERYLRQGLSEADDQGYAVALWYMRSF